MKALLRFLRRLGVAGLLVAGVAGAGYASWVRVDVGERAIVLRLGRYDRTLEPGVGWRIPLLERVEREQVRDRRIEFGAVGGGEAPGAQAEPRMLTGDQNLVDLQFFVEYRVSSVRDFRLEVSDPEPIIREVVRGAMREVVGRSPVDEVIGAARASIPAEVRQLAAERLDRYEVGVELTQVGLQNVEPPEEVKPAFDDVTSAVQDRDRLIQDAQRFRAEVLQRAMGEAAEIVAQAEAQRDSVITVAEGEAAAFTALLREYRKAPEVTRSRLYIQALEEILPRMEKVILQEGSGERMLPYLPIGRAGAVPPASLADPARGGRETPARAGEQP